MNKILPTILITFFVLFINPFDIFAASLEVSKNSSFSTSDLNFGGGETVYIRTKVGEASTHVLNIKDSSYSTIKTVNLTRSGDSYTASFSAPNMEGYYSLEVKIEGSGTSSTSVKTIKVGSPDGANIKVNVNTSVRGTQTNGSNGTNVTEVSSEVRKEDQSDENSDEDKEQLDASQEPEFFENENKVAQTNWLWSAIKGVFSFFWIF